jgi:hypothetical protein
LAPSSAIDLSRLDAERDVAHAVRKLLAQFKGAAFEVALEATANWRFVVDNSTASAPRRAWPSRPRLPR